MKQVLSVRCHSGLHRQGNLEQARAQLHLSKESAAPLRSSLYSYHNVQGQQCPLALHHRHGARRGGPRRRGRPTAYTHSKLPKFSSKMSTLPTSWSVASPLKVRLASSLISISEPGGKSSPVGYTDTTTQRNGGWWKETVSLHVVYGLLGKFDSARERSTTLGDGSIR